AGQRWSDCWKSSRASGPSGGPGTGPHQVGEGQVRLPWKAASDRSRSADLNDWVPSGDFEDILYETGLDGGVAKITINRPEVRNAFRPTTLFELSRAFNVARDDPKVGVIILTGAGTEAFCSGGD